MFTITSIGTDEAYHVKLYTKAIKQNTQQMYKPYELGVGIIKSTIIKLIKISRI